MQPLGTHAEIALGSAAIFVAKCIVLQVDGNDTSGEDDTSDDDVIRPSNHGRIGIIESDSESSMNHDKEVGHSDSESDGDSDEPFLKIIDELGRQHVKYPHTGETYIFWKSHFHKGSDIEKHCDDFVNMYQSTENFHENLFLF